MVWSACRRQLSGACRTQGTEGLHSHTHITTTHPQIGNGLFWTFPFMLQWLSGRILGSGLIDNGRLDDLRFG